MSMIEQCDDEDSGFEDHGLSSLASSPVPPASGVLPNSGHQLVRLLLAGWEDEGSGRVGQSSALISPPSPPDPKVA